LTVATFFGVGDQMVEVLEHRDDGSVQCSLSADTHWRIEMSRYWQRWVMRQDTDPPDLSYIPLLPIGLTGIRGQCGIRPTKFKKRHAPCSVALHGVPG